MEILKVSGKSKPMSLAGAISGTINENGFAEIQAIGAGAVNQAVKAIAIARGILAPSGKNLIVIPAFTEVELENEIKTAIKFIVRPNNI